MPKHALSRRQLLLVAGGALAAPALAAQRPEAAMRPRIAAIVTEYRDNSHADVIVTKYLEGLDVLDVSFHPRGQIVSLYTDQVPDNDLSRDYAGKHNVPIYPTIAGALCRGGDRLAVDGALLIGEHGRYPSNEKGQHLYPRRRFFDEAVAVIRAAGRPIPLFSDKHLSWNWQDARFMADTARELGVPFMAGSSLPLTWRKPELELPLESPIEDALVAAYGGNESYGFHALETLQCMLERRRGGETGVQAVSTITGDAVWAAGDAGRWSWDLLNAALATATTASAGDVKERAGEPVAFLIEYVDGTRGTVLMLNGKLQQFLFAGRVRGQEQPVATCFWLQDEKPFGHFAILSDAIDRMFVSGNPTYPVERTLLTTGILDRVMNSLFEGGRRLETPELAAIRYQAPAVPRPLARL